VILDEFTDEQKSRATYKTGLAIAPYFSASKMSWMLRNVPEVKSAADAGNLLFGTIDTWIIWNLTQGSHITDVTNASRTLLMDLETLSWDESLLSDFGVPRSALPEIKSSSEIYDATKTDGNFGAPVPIAGILGDQHAAMVGQLCFERGDTKCTYGTGNFALVNTGTEIVRSKKGLLTTLCFKFGEAPARYALEGSVAVTGSAVQWLRDQLGIIAHASDIEGLANSVADNGGVYFVPAFSGLFAPYWRSDARGVLVGLTRAATKAHIARATLEAIAYQTKDVIDAMAAETGVELTSLRVDGGITQNNLCMQIQSDILKIDISRPVVSETTALGAAYAAGLAVGIWPDLEALRSQWRESARWTPDRTSDLAQGGYENWQKAVDRTLNWIE
jgi:glycerol kinase